MRRRQGAVERAGAATCTPRLETGPSAGGIGNVAGEIDAMMFIIPSFFGPALKILQMTKVLTPFLALGDYRVAFWENQ